MSYVMKDGDSVESLASRFGVSMDSIEQVNGISNPDNFTVGDLYYIPLNSGNFSCFNLILVLKHEGKWGGEPFQNAVRLLCFESATTANSA